MAKEGAEGVPRASDDSGVGPRATSAFNRLGNDTRLSILLALWDAHEPASAENAVSFTSLRDRVGVEQGGKFNYHLDKLVGDFVRKTNGGYVLRRAGKHLIQAVISGVGIEEERLERTPIDLDCPYCGGPTVVSYEDESLHHRCTECAGCLGDRYDERDGLIMVVPFDPAGFDGRSPTELYHASAVRSTWATQMFIEGVCPTCSGRVDSSVDVCPDHDDGICTTCGRRPGVMAELRCRTCKEFTSLPPSKVVSHHPAVVSFYHDHGISLQYGLAEPGSPTRRETLRREHEQELVATDPPEVVVTVEYEGDSLSLRLDESLAVLEVREPGE
jgi:hypothetical protein